MFIVFEGGEGVGKTTQIELVHAALQNKNLPCLKTREPGGTPLAEKIRNLFKELTNDPPLPLTGLHLICAARAQHVQNILEPNQDKIILCDRFLDSTYVYQSILGNISKKDVDFYTQPILKGLIPDLTFVFYCENNIVQERLNKDTLRVKDRLDSCDSNFHQSLSESYKKIFHEDFTYPCGIVPKRILIHASSSVEQVFEKIKSSFNQYLNIQL